MVGGRLRRQRECIGFLELAGTLPARCRDGVGGGDQRPVLPGRTWPPEPIGAESRVIAGSWSTRVGSGWAVGWRSSDGCSFAHPRPGRRTPWRLGLVLMYSLTLALVGNRYHRDGDLVLDPGTVLL